jgi:hypothetical protein
MFPSYDLTLPLPTSVNQNYQVARNRKGGFIVRSPEYTKWIDEAGRFWRDQYRYGVKELFSGRIKVIYVFILNDSDFQVSQSSDISNREKGLSDFLERKFYLNGKVVLPKQRWYSQAYCLFK